MKHFLLPVFILLALLPGGIISAQGLDGYGGGPVIYVKLFNDGEYGKQLSFIVHSTSTHLYYQDWQAGIIPTERAVEDAYCVWLVQDMEGEFSEVDKREWQEVAKQRRGIEVDWDLVVDLVAIPFDAVGDAATGLYYVCKGDYESAMYSVIAIVVPFANGQMLRGGRYLVKKGVRGAERLMELTPDEIWKLKPGLRGELIEDILVKTRYKASRGFTHMREASWYWPVFDVVKDDMIISIKTTQATQGFGSLIDNIRELDWLVKTQKTLNGDQVIRKARLDIYVPQGYDVGQLARVEEMAAGTSVDVKIFYF